MRSASRPPKAAAILALSNAAFQGFHWLDLISDNTGCDLPGAFVLVVDKNLSPTDK